MFMPFCVRPCSKLKDDLAMDSSSRELQVWSKLTRKSNLTCIIRVLGPVFCVYMASSLSQPSLTPALPGRELEEERENGEGKGPLPRVIPLNKGMGFRPGGQG